MGGSRAQWEYLMTTAAEMAGWLQVENLWILEWFLSQVKAGEEGAFSED